MMTKLIIGGEYDRPYLAKHWGYSSYNAIGRGIVTPKDKKVIILFVTKENQACLTQYDNYFDSEEELLYMEGETGHRSDSRIINANKECENIFLFYREKHHSPFRYYGEVYLVSYELKEELPSRFVFTNSLDKVLAINTIECEDECTFKEIQEYQIGIKEIEYQPEFEGRLKISRHKRFERSIKNRAEAIKIHGVTCKICGFNFNDFYGEDLADKYIEVHHIRPISRNNGIINPKNDLITVCANCHRMLHRRKENNVSIEELKKRIKI